MGRSERGRSGRRRRGDGSRPRWWERVWPLERASLGTAPQLAKASASALGPGRLRPDTYRVSVLQAEPALPTMPAPEEPTSAEAPHFELPQIRQLARHALPRIVEGGLLPLLIFYLFLAWAGVHGAIYASCAWTYVALLRRLVRRQRVPGLLVLTAIGVTARTAVAMALHSTFIYFLQPSLATVLVGCVFLVSVRDRQPLAQRLAHDFVPLPESLLHRPAVRRVFVRITLLWAFTNLLNAGGAILLLLTLPVSTYVVARTGLSWTLMGSAVGLSVLLFKRTVGLGRAGRSRPAAA
jgi:intracellular septation protein A